MDRQYLSKGKNILTSILLGAGLTIAISFVVLVVGYNPITNLAEIFYGIKIATSDGYYIEIYDLAHYIISGIICFLLLIAFEKPLEKEFRQKVYNIFFFIAVIISVILCAFGLVFFIQNVFAAITVFIEEIFMWIVALLLYFIVKVIKKLFIRKE